MRNKTGTVCLGPGAVPWSWYLSRPVLGGDEDGPATDSAVAKVVDRVVGGFQRVAAGVERDFALTCERDEAGQVGVGADEVGGGVISPNTSCMVRSVTVPP